MKIDFTDSPDHLIGFEAVHRGFIIAASQFAEPRDFPVVASLKAKLDAVSDLCHCGKMITVSPPEPGRRLRGPATVEFNAEETRVYARLLSRLLESGKG